MAPNTHQYTLLYRLTPNAEGGLDFALEEHPEGVPVERIPEGMGACDAALFASIMYPKDGSLSVYFIGADGRSGKELEDLEWFKVWALLAHRLGNSKTLSPTKKLVASEVFELIRKSVLQGGK